MYKHALHTCVLKAVMVCLYLKKFVIYHVGMELWIYQWTVSKIFVGIS